MKIDTNKNFSEKELSLLKYGLKHYIFSFTNHAIKNFITRQLNLLFIKEEFEELNKLIALLECAFKCKDFKKSLNDYLNKYIHAYGEIYFKDSIKYKERDNQDNRIQTIKIKAKQMVFIVNFHEKVVITSEVKIEHDKYLTSLINSMNGLDDALLNYLSVNNKNNFIESLKEYFDITKDTNTHKNNPDINLVQVLPKNFTSEMKELFKLEVIYNAEIHNLNKKLLPIDILINNYLERLKVARVNIYFYFLMDGSTPIGITTFMSVGSDKHNKIIAIDKFYTSILNKGYEAFILNELELVLKNIYKKTNIMINLSINRVKTFELKNQYEGCFFKKLGYEHIKDIYNGSNEEIIDIIKESKETFVKFLTL